MERRKLAILTALLIGFVAGFFAMDSRSGTAARDTLLLRETARRQGFEFDIVPLCVLSPEDIAHAAPFTNARKRLQDRLVARNSDLEDPLFDEREIETMMHAALEDRPLRFSPGPGETPVSLKGGIYTNAWGEWADILALESLADTLVNRTAIGMKCGRHDEAWTNLLALNAVAARYRPGPFAGAHCIAARLVQTAFRLDYETLQAHSWSDRRLAELDHLWRHAEPLRGLDSVPVGAGANLLSLNNADRIDVRRRIQVSPSAMFAPVMTGTGPLWRRICGELKGFAMRRDFVRRTSYLTDADIVRFHQRKAGVFQRALGCATWRDMSSVPGLTNPPPPVLTNLRSKILLQNSGWSQLADNSLDYDDSKDPFMAKVEAETRRRIILAAIAVERARIRLGRLPATLAEAGDVPPDFMDGQPLRYRTEPDGTYKIYSVGFDLADDGGSGFDWSGPASGSQGDMVWPRLSRDSDMPNSNPAR